MNIKCRPKILYIDDNADSRKLVRRLLTAEYKFKDAGDAESGIIIAQEFQPDLILMDLNLPGLDGSEAMVRMKALFHGTPVLALTADGSRVSRERALAAGFDDYITKPIDVTKFYIKIREFTAV